MALITKIGKVKELFEKLNAKTGISKTDWIKSDKLKNLRLFFNEEGKMQVETKMGVEFGVENLSENDANNFIRLLKKSFRKPIKAKVISKLNIPDPDNNKKTLYLTVIKLETGIIMGIDTSFFNTNEPVYSIYDKNLEILIEP